MRRGKVEREGDRDKEWRWAYKQSNVLVLGI